MNGFQRLTAVRAADARHLFCEVSALFVLLALLAGLTAVAAQAGELAGNWSGGGTVAFVSGQNEKARCRATYFKRAENSYGVKATCATASGRAVQYARLKQISPNTYSGSFYNDEFKTSGTFVVSVRGNMQNVSIYAGKGSAQLTLRR